MGRERFSGPGENGWALQNSAKGTQQEGAKDPMERTRGGRREAKKTLVGCQVQTWNIKKKFFLHKVYVYLGEGNSFPVFLPVSLFPTLTF